MATTTERVTALEREAAAARRRLTEAARLLVDKVLDKAGYDALRGAEQERLARAEAELERLNIVPVVATLPLLDVVLQQAGGWARLLRDADVTSQRSVLATLVETIVPSRVRRGEYRADLVWFPLGRALQRGTSLTSSAAA